MRIEEESRGKDKRKKGRGGKNQRSHEIMLLCLPHSEESCNPSCPAPYLSQFHNLSQPADHPSNSPPPTLKVGVAWGVVNSGQSVVEGKCSSMREKF